VQQTTIVYSGRVQGVGFRFTIRSLAKELGIGGWVRNNDDGSVTMLAEGTREQIETLRARLRDSGVGRIDSEEETFEQRSAGLQTFDIVR